MVSGRALLALLGLTLLAGCHEGDQQGAVDPPHPIVGTWRDVADGSHYWFGPKKDYSGPIPGDRWRRQAASLIAIWTIEGPQQPPETVETHFGEGRDCVRITWRADGGRPEKTLARALGEEKFAQCPPSP